MEPHMAAGCENEPTDLMLWAFRRAASEQRTGEYGKLIASWSSEAVGKTDHCWKGCLLATEDP